MAPQTRNSKYSLSESWGVVDEDERSTASEESDEPSTAPSPRYRTRSATPQTSRSVSGHSPNAYRVRRSGRAARNSGVILRNQDVMASARRSSRPSAAGPKRRSKRLAQTEEEVYDDSDGVLDSLGEEMDQSQDFVGSEMDDSVDQSHIMVNTPGGAKNLATAAEREAYAANRATVNPPRRRSTRPENRATGEPEFSLIMPYAESTIRQRAPQSKGSPRNAAVSRPKKKKLTQDSPFVVSVCLHLWNSFLVPIFKYVGGVLGGTLGHLQPLLSIIFAIALVVATISVGKAIVAQKLSLFSMTEYLGVPTLTDPCSIPIVSLGPWCRRKVSKGHAEFEQLVGIQKGFEGILRNSVRGFSVPHEMKRGEVIVRDMKMRVGYSTIPSKAELANEFTTFIELAQVTSKDFMTYNTHIARAADIILSSNKATMRVLRDLIEANDPSRQNLVSKAWTAFTGPSRLDPEAAAMKEYLILEEHTEFQILLLLDESGKLLQNLNAMDEQLDVINAILHRDGIRLAENRDELLKSLWSKLGGNSGGKKKIDRDRKLLFNFETYRQGAQDVVLETMLSLQALQTRIEDLHDRVRAPTHQANDLSLEQHIEIINAGVERLYSGRVQQRTETESKRLALTSSWHDVDIAEIEGPTGKMS